MKFNTFMTKFWRDTSGATAVEYALVVSTLSIVIISSMVIVGGHTSNTWDTVSDAVNDAD